MNGLHRITIVSRPWLWPDVVRWSAPLGVYLVGALLGTPWGGLLAVIVVLVAWYATTAVRDPVGFSSLAIPSLAISFAGGLLGFGLSGAVLATLALAYLFAFALGTNDLWTWWTRHVLRRRLPSPQHQFEVPFAQAVRTFLSAVWEAQPSPQPIDDPAVEAARARERLVALSPPDDNWRDLQARWAAVMADELSWFTAPPPEDVRRRHSTDIDRLAERQHQLRGRESEWRGPFPTMPKTNEHSSRA